jgi:hypothetical protein
VESFTSNLATTTVSSGGTDAPASGTQETWTVSSSTGFVASTNLSQFHVSDPVQPSETIAVTNVSGLTWTVTRGAENTTPVSHDAGFTVFQVVTAGFLANNLIQVIPPSGDGSGATDVANINATLAAGKPVYLVPGGNYTINSPILPQTASFITGFQWDMSSQDDYYGTGSGNPTGAVITSFGNFVGPAMIYMPNDTYDQYYGVDISGISLISFSPPSGMHSLEAYGYWGACFLRGIQLQKPYQDCLHIGPSGVTNGICDDWMVSACKFSGARHGNGVTIQNNIPDSWFVDCESSENSGDGWKVNWCDNTRWDTCKGENNGGAGWHFTGTSADAMVMLTGCTTQLNSQDGFLWDSGTAGYFILTGCRSNQDNQSASTYASFHSAGSGSRIIGTGCLAAGAAYGAYQSGSGFGMSFTGSYLTGTTANTYDDGSSTNPLINLLPAYTQSFGTGIAAGVVGLSFVGSGTTLVNAALGNAFSLTLTASTTTLGNPSNSVDGQVIKFRITQGSGGSYTLSYDTAYDFGAAGHPTLSTSAGKVDILEFEYVGSLSKWCYLGSALGN